MSALDMAIVVIVAAWLVIVGAYIRSALKAADERLRLRRLLSEANDAFDECTSDYAKSLVVGEEWRLEARQ